jgi:hypothetical protein
MEIEEFLENVAKAKFIQKMEEDVMARAISKVFGEEK